MGVELRHRDKNSMVWTGILMSLAGVAVGLYFILY